MKPLRIVKNFGGGGNPSLGLDLTRFWGVEESEKKNKPSFFSAFTLAEMMVVMLILSIVLAAMAPVMTTRYKSRPNNSSPWLYENNNRINAWFGSGPAQHAMIGQSSYGADDTIAKLLITVGDDTTNFLAFKRNNTNIGRLFIGGTNLLLGNLTSGTLGDGSVGIGRNLQTGANSTAVGSSTNASGANAIAVGQGSNASAENSVAIGGNAKVENYTDSKGNTFSSSGAIAVGSSATSSGASSIAIGQSAYTSGVNTLVIGNNASIQSAYGRIPSREKDKPDGSVVIGAHASSVLYDQETSKNVVVIGNGAKADAPLQLNGDGVIAIGENARAKQEGAIALGKGAEADGYYWNSSHDTGYASAIAIGTSAKSYRPRSIAIGQEATITSSQLGDSIAIGTKATAASSYGSNIAIGAKSNANGSYSIALGNGVNTRWGNYDTYYWGLPTLQKENFSSGEMSIAIGVYSYAKGSNSIAIGSLESFSSDKPYYPYSGGESSIAIGTGAQSAGKKSVAIGYNAAATNDSGIAIGNGAKAYANTSVAIGYNVVNNRESVIQLGNPTDTVYIPGNLVVEKSSILGYAKGKSQLYNDDIIHTYLRGTRQNYKMNEFIGSDDNKGDDRDANNITLEGYNTGIPNFLSDRRLKYVGKENKSGLDKIRQLKVFNYTFKKDTKKEPHVGIIAQDLQKVFPNAVKKGADGFLTIRMEDMFYAVINAIKELDAKYQAQEKRITAIEKENKELKARLDRLEAKVK